MRPLRIGIDGDALRAPLSGVGQYVYHLSCELTKVLPEATFIAYSRLPREALRLPSKQWQLRTERSSVFRQLPSFLWFKIRVRAMCETDGIEVFWAGRTLHPGGARGVRTVCTVHDLNHLVSPETMQFQSRWSNRLWFRSDVLSADCVLANSHGTAERIRTLVGGKVNGVVSPGVTANFRRLEPVEELELVAQLTKLGISKPYLLSVATPEPRKNLENVLQAYIQLKGEGFLQNYSLILAGPDGWKNRGLDKILKTGRPLGVTMVGYIPDVLMPALYQNAEALVFPSFYEGFGMPVLEARCCGGRVVTTDSPELREAGDQHVVYVEPTIDGIKAGILKAISLPKPPPGNSRRWQDGARVLARALCEK